MKTLGLIIGLLSSATAWAVTANQGTGPLQFIQDGQVSTVLIDSGTPGNNNPLPVTVVSGGSSSQTVNQGPPGPIASPWPVIPSDGTYTQEFTSDGEGKVSVTKSLPAGANTIGAVTQDGTWDITDITGTVSLPTNASQETGGNLETIANRTPALGPAPMASSVPVVIASDHANLPVVIASPLPSGANTIGSVSISGSLPAGSNTIGAVTQDSGPWTQNLTQLGGNSPSATNSLPVQITDGSSFVDPTDIRALTSSDVVTSQINDGAGNAITSASAGSTRPLDVSLRDSSGNLIDPSSPKFPINASGSFDSDSINSASTSSAPSNAVGFILQALDSNTANIRYAVGDTASASNGMQLQPGRDSGFIPIGNDVSIAPESGTQGYTIQWVIQ